MVCPFRIITGLTCFSADSRACSTLPGLSTRLGLICASTISSSAALVSAEACWARTISSASFFATSSVSLLIRFSLMIQPAACFAPILAALNSSSESLSNVLTVFCESLVPESLSIFFTISGMRDLTRPSMLLADSSVQVSTAPRCLLIMSKMRSTRSSAEILAAGLIS